VTLLATHGLSARYGDAQALFGIDFRLDPGEVVAIIGANGAGKSTFMKALTGLVRAPSEQVSFEDEPIGGLPPAEIVRRGIALVPEGRRLFPSLSVEENLRMGATAKRAGPWHLERVYALFPILRDKRARPSTSLSGGQQQMVAIARALLNENRVLLVDEPTKGLAPSIIDNLIAAFRELKKTDTTILMVEQNFHAARSLGDSVAVMDGGRIVHRGGMAALAADEALQARLLGLSLESHQ
jgi:branched-chain amino acid transport system ATP-binding protein